jgi:ankyrin repeat protein
MYGGAALHYASVRGHLKVVEALLNAGAKINEVATDHSTSLMLAALYHVTPLMWAAGGGHHDVVSSLITRRLLVAW